MIKRLIKKLFKSRIFYKETDLKIISLFVEKTYPVFAGTFSDKVSKQTLFVVGKTEYGPIKIPISENIHKILQNKINTSRNKIPIKIRVKLKMEKAKRNNHTELKILAGKVIFETKKE